MVRAMCASALVSAPRARVRFARDFDAMLLKVRAQA
jgi:hypothetical protein